MPVPNQFTPGELISSSEMNANFDSVDADITAALSTGWNTSAAITIPSEMPFVGVSQRANSTAVSYWTPVPMFLRYLNQPT